MKNVICCLMLFLFLDSADAGIDGKEENAFVTEKTVKINSGIEKIIEKTSSLIDDLDKMIQDPDEPDEITGKQMQEIVERLDHWNKETIKNISYFCYYYHSPHGEALEEVLQIYHTLDRKRFESLYTISKAKLMEIKKEICISFDHMQKRYMDANLISADLIDLQLKKEIGMSATELVNMYKLVDEDQTKHFIHLWKDGTGCSQMAFNLSKEMECFMYVLLSERSHYASVIMQEGTRRFTKETADDANLLPKGFIVFNPYFNLILNKRIMPKSKKDIILFRLESLWGEVERDNTQTMFDEN